MTLFLVDASHYQPSLPIESLPRQGFSALILKATEGTGYTDPSFSAFLARARKIGLPVAAYHFLHPGAADAQAAHIAAVVPKDVPVWMDAEAGSTRDDAYACANALRRRGGLVGGIYNGSRPRSGYGGWWRPAYLSDPSESATSVYARQGGDTGSGWDSGPDLWQFCQHGRITGYSGDVDFSAYRGSRAQLLTTRWFWTKEVDMPLTKADAALVIDQLLLTKLGSSGPTIGVALQETAHLAALGVDGIARAVVAALPSGSSVEDVDALAVPPSWRSSRREQ